MRIRHLLKSTRDFGDRQYSSLKPTARTAGVFFSDESCFTLETTINNQIQNYRVYAKSSANIAYFENIENSLLTAAFPNGVGNSLQMLEVTSDFRGA